MWYNDIIKKAFKSPKEKSDTNWRKSQLTAIKQQKRHRVVCGVFSFTPLNGGGPIRSRHYEYYYTQHYMRVYIYIKIIKGRYYGREKQSSRVGLYKNIGPKT